MTERTPAEFFSPGSYVCEELRERGWPSAHLFLWMGWPPTFGQRFLRGEAPLYVGDAEKLSRYFGVSALTWLSLEQTWRDRPRDAK